MGRVLLVLIVASFAVAGLDALLRSLLPLPLDDELLELSPPKSPAVGAPVLVTSRSDTLVPKRQRTTSKHCELGLRALARAATRVPPRNSASATRVSPSGRMVLCSKPSPTSMA